MLEKVHSALEKLMLRRKLLKRWKNQRHQANRFAIVLNVERLVIQKLIVLNISEQKRLIIHQETDETESEESEEEITDEETEASETGDNDDSNDDRNCYALKKK